MVSRGYPRRSGGRTGYGDCGSHLLWVIEEALAFLAELGGIEADIGELSLMLSPSLRLTIAWTLILIQPS